MSSFEQRRSPEKSVDSDIFEGAHLTRAVLHKFVYGKFKMKKKDRIAVEHHLKHDCKGECQGIIDEMNENDQRNDRKGSQIPVHDR
ncbi:hypothetical protein KW791_03795 [Candidatus Parcubacteria bacterium]|nr:hypothetical protein [Candidatus Parcubacteria bacterium]